MTFFRFLALMMFASAAAAQVPAKMEEPTIDRAMFRVDPVTGSLIELEKIYSAEKRAGNTYQMYLPGLKSRVAFPFGERMMFAKRVIGDQSLEEERETPSVLLERLAPKEYAQGALWLSTPEGRYATKVYVPLRVTTYGEPMYGLSRIDKDTPARTYLYTPTEVLPPGEYAFSFRGLLSGGDSITEAYAFRIVRGMASVARPPQAPASPPSSPNPISNMNETQRAAQQGNATAQLKLGSAYASGTGVLQDYVEAHKWLNIAAARLEGDDRARAAALRDQVASRMTPEQVAQAQKGAREWMESFQRR